MLLGGRSALERSSIPPLASLRSFFLEYSRYSPDASSRIILLTFFRHFTPRHYLESHSSPVKARESLAPGASS